MRRAWIAVPICLLLALAALFLSAAAPPATQPDLPRYALPIGRQFTYSGEFSFHTDRGDVHTLATVEITVIAHNPDGSARLLVRESQKERDAKADPDSETVQFVEVDMTDAGRVLSTSGEPTANVPETLPRLPDSAAQLATGWIGDPILPASTVHYSVPQPSSPHAPGTFTFSRNTAGEFNIIYGNKRQETLTFDLAKGLVTEMSGTVHQEFGFKGDGTITSKLTDDRNLPAGKASLLAADAQIYFDTQTTFDKLIGQVQESPDRFQSISQDISAALGKASSDLQTDYFKKPIDDLRKETDEAVDDARSTASASLNWSASPRRS